MEYNIRIPGKLKSEAEIGDLVIAYLDNGPVYVKDVAKVEFTFKDLKSRARPNSRESVSLTIKKRTGTDMGVIALAGVVVNNAIVLIDYIGQLRKRGYEMKEAIQIKIKANKSA